MKLQFQQSDGSWMDCAEDTDRFLAECVKYGRTTVRSKAPSESEVIAALSAGKTVRYWGEAWYDYCRDGEVVDARTAHNAARAADTREVLHCGVCGNAGARGEYPFSTLPDGDRCDDCI